MHIWLIALLVCINSFTLPEQSIQNFLQASSCYNNGEYQRADSLYGSCSQTAHTLYNRGNCAYQLQQYPQAFIYWLRAARCADRELYKKITHNMGLLSSHWKRAHHYNAVVEESSITRLVQSCSLARLQIIWLFMWAMIVFSLLYIRFRGLSVRTGYLVSPVLYMIWIATTGMLYIKHHQVHDTYAVGAQELVVLRSGPGELYHPCGQLSGCARGVVCQEQNGWYKLSYNGKMGWASKQQVIIL